MNKSTYKDKKASRNNEDLAISCGRAQTNCCKDGYLFLTKPEYERILLYLADKTLSLKEFLSRITDHGDFLLYDQKDRCQFLDQNDLCKLHPIGIKPIECFWWPAHVYASIDGELEIRVANCCGGCNMLNANSDHIGKVAREAEEIGYDVLKKFRKIVHYGETYPVIAKLQTAKNSQ